MLVEYLRDDNANPVGAVVCIGVYEGDPAIGWSIRSPREKGFSKRIAREVAEGRAKKLHRKHSALEILRILERKTKYYSFRGDRQRAQNFYLAYKGVDRMKKRAEKYYKTREEGVK